jgi:hypothetical protein
MKEVPALRNLSLLLILALAGCGTGYSAAATAEADATAKTVFAGCEDQFRSGKLRSYRLTVECARPGVTQAYQMAGYPFMDLVELGLNARRYGADRIDAGLAAPQDVSRDLAELDRRILGERERRVAARKGIGGEAAPATPAQMMDGLPSLNERVIPPSNANCFKVGSFTHCD